MARVSAVIKARNEEHQIASSIQAARLLADEVIVVDDRSTDGTARVAVEAGARVIAAESHHGFINELDRIGFEAATGEWMLRLDADERLTEGLANALKAVADEGTYSGVRFARRNIMFGAWARHGGWFRADQLRFFRRDAWRRHERGWERDLHGHPDVEGPILTLPEHPDYATIHLDYDDVPQFAERTLYRYARTEALDRFRRGARFSVLRLFLRPLRRFLGRYVVRQGFRDGRRGLVLAVLLATYDVMIELNLWDVGRAESVGGSPGDRSQLAP